MPNNPSTHPGTASDERGYRRIRVRQDTLANWLKNNPILASGEFGYVIGAAPGQNLVIGDGTSRFSQLSFLAGGGNSGPPGPAGQSSTIAIGTVTPLPFGQATVTNSGTQSAAILNFGVPTGQRGEKGDQGDKGEPGPAGSATFSVYKGPYDPSFNYQPGDVCRFNNRLYLRIGAAGAGNGPGTSYWQFWDAVSAIGLAWESAPAASNSPGAAGSVAYDANYFYVAVGNSSWKRAPISAWAVAAVPTAPQNLAGASGAAKAFLSWAAPASDGGSPILSYVIEQSSNGGTTWTSYPQGASASATSVTIDGLTNGTAYSLRIAAVNAVGRGEWASTSVTPSSSAFEPVGIFETVAPHSVSASKTFTVPEGATKMVAFAIGAGHPLGASGGWAYKQWSVTAGQQGTVTHTAGDRLSITFAGDTIAGGDGRRVSYNTFSSLGGLFYGGDGGQQGEARSVQIPCAGRGAALRLPVSKASADLTLSGYPLGGSDILRPVGFAPQMATNSQGVQSWVSTPTPADILAGAARLANVSIKETNSPTAPAIGSGGYWEFSVAPPEPTLAGAEWCYGSKQPAIPYLAGAGAGGVSVVDTRVQNNTVGLSASQQVVPPGSSAYAIYFYSGDALSFPPLPAVQPAPPPPTGGGTGAIPFIKVYDGIGTQVLIVPTGVTSIKAWAIGGGGFGNGSGGAGGGLAWKTWSVSAGQRIDISVGMGGRDGSPATSSTVTVGTETILASPGSDNGLNPGLYSPNADGGASGSQAASLGSQAISGGCISTPAGTDSNCNRKLATDAGGLFAAFAAAGGKTKEDCGFVAAIGSGGYVSQALGAYNAGYGGGGGRLSSTLAANAGNGLVIIYGFSSADPATPPAPSLSAPLNLVATAGNAEVSLAWSPPSSTGGTAISSYKIEYSSNGGTSWSAASSPASAVTASTISGLTNGVDYLFRVAAVGGGTAGPFASTSSPSTPTAGSSGSARRAMIVTNTQTIPVPAGMTRVKAWAVGGGTYAIPLASRITTQGRGLGGGSGACAYKSWAVQAGDSIECRIESNPSQSSFALPANAGSATVIRIRASGESEGFSAYAGQYVYGGLTTSISGAQQRGVGGKYYPTNGGDGGADGGDGIGQQVGSLSRGGAIGGGLSPTSQFASDSPYCRGRQKANNVSGLLDAVALAGGIASESCSGSPAFGSGAAVGFASDQQGLISNSVTLLPAGNGGGGAEYSANSGDYYRLEPGEPAIVLLFENEPLIADPPGTPQSVAGYPGDTQVSLTWSASTTGGAASDYFVQYSIDNGASWVSVTRAQSALTSAQVTGLKNDVDYIFRVAASSAAGTSAWSAPSASVRPRTTPPPPPGPPTAPTSVVGTPGNRQIQLSWATPSSNGGSAITGYSIQIKAVTDASWTPLTGTYQTTSATITGLTNGVLYAFRVYAFNALGNSPLSDPSAAVAPAGEPEPMVIGSISSNGISSTQAAVALSWDYRYSQDRLDTVTVQYSSDGGANWTTAIEFNGSIVGARVSDSVTVSIGPTYTFRIRHITASNVSSPWASWPAITPQAASSQMQPPTNLTPTPQNASVYLSWSAPSTGSPDGYDVQYGVTSISAGGVPQTTWTAFSSAAPTNALVTGLTNGVSYQFRVRSYKSGATPSSWVQTAAIPATAPGAPTGVTATPGNASVSLAWSAPAATGGSPIIDYYIEVSSGGQAYQRYADGISTATSAVVSGLTNGTQYSFKVYAVTSAGESAASSVVSATPSAAPAAPSAPQNLVATPGNASITLSWQAPISSGTQPITDYVVEYRLASASSWTLFADGVSTSLSATITGLVNGSSYVCRVSGKSSVGVGTAAVSSAVTPKASVPGAPTINSAAVSGGTAGITWIPPFDNGGSAITSYTIQSSTNGTTWTTVATTGSSATSASIANLPASSTYSFRVAAQNSSGLGPWSAAFAATSGTAPAAPAAPTVTVGPRSATVSWAAPANGGSAITGYLVQWKRAADANWQQQSAPSSPATINNLDSDTDYEFRVAAVNGIGIGPYSPVVSARTPIVSPSAPLSILATAGDGAVVVSWTAPQDTGGGTLTGYELQRQTYNGTAASGWSAVTSPSASTLSYTDTVANGTKVEYRVRACNSAGCGAWATSLPVVPESPISIRTYFPLPKSTSKWANPSTTNLSTDGTYDPNCIAIHEATTSRAFVGTGLDGAILSIEYAANQYSSRTILARVPCGALDALHYRSGWNAATQSNFYDFYASGRGCGLSQSSPPGAAFSKQVSDTIHCADFSQTKNRVWFMASYTGSYPWRPTASSGSSAYELGYYDYVNDVIVRNVADMSDFYIPGAFVAGSAILHYPTPWRQKMAVVRSGITVDNVYVLLPFEGSNTQSRLFCVRSDNPAIVTEVNVGNDITDIAEYAGSLVAQTSSGLLMIDPATNEVVRTSAGPAGSRILVAYGRNRIYSAGNGTLAAYSFGDLMAGGGTASQPLSLVWTASLTSQGVTFSSCTGLALANNGDVWGTFGKYVVVIAPRLY